MGTNNGVVEFYPQNAFKSGTNFTINHLKVPRNDGTNLADYLLDNTDVTCIAVDGSNRKWIGTSTSGVLLVNEDGSEIIEQFTTEISHYMRRHDCKPGITGWAQVHGLRGNTSIEARLNHDLWYQENWSLALDLKIMLRTVFAVRNAY